MQELIKYLRDKFISESSGHDFDHLQRVVKTALFLNETEDVYLVELTAWLHDYFDYKFYQGELQNDLKPLLNEVKIELNEIDYLQLVYDLQNFGFKGGFNEGVLSEVGKLVEDADRLDAIGAIGIARTCMYGGNKGHKLYGEDNDRFELKTFEDYKSRRSIVQHFEDKLLKLKDLMHTEKAKKLALERHQFMLEFLKQLDKEINL